MKAKGKALEVAKTQIALDENNAIAKVKHDLVGRLRLSNSGQCTVSSR